MKTAQKISSVVLDQELSAEQKKVAGPLVDYAYGTGIGALYGGLAQRHETTTSGFGSAYGAAAWALGDDIAVPALGLPEDIVQELRSKWNDLPRAALEGLALEHIDPAPSQQLSFAGSSVSKPGCRWTRF